MTEKNGYPNPNDIFPNEFGTTCFLKNVVKAPNIEIGDYTYYDDAAGPQHFEERNVLFNWPQFGDRLVIGKFCAIGSGTQFVMGAANHRLGSASTYPFAVFGGRWAQRVPPHMAQLPAPGRHRGGQRRVVWPHVHGDAGREDRRRSHYCRAQRGGARYSALHGGGRPTRRAW